MRMHTRQSVVMPMPILRRGCGSCCCFLLLHTGRLPRPSLASSDTAAFSHSFDLLSRRRSSSSSRSSHPSQSSSTTRIDVFSMPDDDVDGIGGATTTTMTPTTTTPFEEYLSSSATQFEEVNLAASQESGGEGAGRYEGRAAEGRGGRIMDIRSDRNRNRIRPEKEEEKEKGRANKQLSDVDFDDFDGDDPTAGDYEAMFESLDARSSSGFEELLRHFRGRAKKEAEAKAEEKRTSGGDYDRSMFSTVVGVGSTLRFGGGSDSGGGGAELIFEGSLLVEGDVSGATLRCVPPPDDNEEAVRSTSSPASASIIAGSVVTIGTGGTLRTDSLRGVETVAVHGRLVCDALECERLVVGPSGVVDAGECLSFRSVNVADGGTVLGGVVRSTSTSTSGEHPKQESREGFDVDDGDGTRTVGQPEPMTTTTKSRTTELIGDTSSSSSEDDSNSNGPLSPPPPPPVSDGVWLVDRGDDLSAASMSTAGVKNDARDDIGVEGATTTTATATANLPPARLPPAIVKKRGGGFVSGILGTLLGAATSLHGGGNDHGGIRTRAENSFHAVEEFDTDLASEIEDALRSAGVEEDIDVDVNVGDEHNLAANSLDVPPVFQTPSSGGANGALRGDNVPPEKIESTTTTDIASDFSTEEGNQPPPSSSSSSPRPWEASRYLDDPTVDSFGNPLVFGNPTGGGADGTSRSHDAPDPEIESSATTTPHPNTASNAPSSSEGENRHPSSSSSPRPWEASRYRDDPTVDSFGNPLVFGNPSSPLPPRRRAEGEGASRGDDTPPEKIESTVQTTVNPPAPTNSAHRTPAEESVDRHAASSPSPRSWDASRYRDDPTVDSFGNSLVPGNPLPPRRRAEEGGATRDCDASARGIGGPAPKKTESTSARLARTLTPAPNPPSAEGRERKIGATAPKKVKGDGPPRRDRLHDDFGNPLFRGATDEEAESMRRNREVTREIRMFMDRSIKDRRDVAANKLKESLQDSSSRRRRRRGDPGSGGGSFQKPPFDGGFKY